MNDYVDGTMSRRNRRRLERHLAGCDACGAFLQQLRVTIAASRAVEPADVEPAVMDALIDVYRKFQSEE
jgi:anti-sigma factor RsiW